MAKAEIKSVEEFDQFLKTHNDNIIVVHFWASWAEQCQQMNEIIDELSKDSKLFPVKFLLVQAEELPTLAERYKIESVPAFVFIRGSKVVDTVLGASGAELNRKIRQYVDSYIPSAPQRMKELNEHLKDLINYDKVMLFMKGTPAEPRCGFSKQIVAILNGRSAKYGSFDILTDNDVREGLKKLSNWPTFPQLYVNGELVGGLDIVKELEASGELEQMLPKEELLEDKLRKLVNKAPVMVFIKGTPDGPKCGFSRQIVKILNDSGVPYESFDILENEEVRQGLKTFSNWPTFPQLYVKGELVGGLDIVKELVAAGDLNATLSPS
ncbi:Glutaredoxin-3 [Hypsibius exemplaris]|uniref:Glutaredoxin-3 n=1 Tax=Hypsibius exemplaris TaxID=2072580 RepID=A0A9X6NGL2_HYPEX|nr:Glutaredoxin-3 [Hypsibius exemplaris]